MVTACKNQPAKIHEAELKTPRKAVSFLGHFLLHMAQGLSCWITFTAIQIAFFLKQVILKMIGMHRGHLKTSC